MEQNRQRVIHLVHQVLQVSKRVVKKVEVPFPFLPSRPCLHFGAFRSITVDIQKGYARWSDRHTFVVLLIFRSMMILLLLGVFCVQRLQACTLPLVFCIWACQTW